MQKLSWVLLLFFLAGTYRMSAQTPTPTSDKAYLLNVHAIGADKAAVRATRDFWEQVGDQKQEKWYKRPEGYLAEYSEGSTLGQYVYNTKGSWIYSILTYTEKEMPTAVRTLVLSTYFDYKIRWVKEVHEQDVVAYVVHIESTTSWKDVAVQDGSMRVLHEYSF